MRGFLVAVLFLSTTTNPPPGGENRRLADHSSAWSGLPSTFLTTLIEWPRSCSPVLSCRMTSIHSG